MKRKNIVLFGFMGTGKSAVAERLGEDLNREVVEMDGIIESREGIPISRIFSGKGEGYFRKLEKELVGELSREEGKIIATGGGVALQPENIEALGRNGILICLRARPEVILKRLEGETHRPLLEVSDRKRRMEEILSSRRPFYDLIENQVDTSDMSVEEAAAAVRKIVFSDREGAGGR